MSRPITQTGLEELSADHDQPLSIGDSMLRQLAEGAEVARGNQARHVIRDTNGTILEINSFGGAAVSPTLRRSTLYGGLSSRVTSLADVPHAAAARGRGELRASDTTLYPRPGWIR